MLFRRSSGIHFVALIFLGYLPFAVESVTVKGRLRNYSHNTKCLRPLGTDNGAELEVVDCSDSSADQIIEANGFQSMESEAGYIQFDIGSKCLSLNGFASDNGVHILSWDCVDQDNQKWKIINGNSGGPFQLQLKSTGKCLTAEGGGTYLDQWDCVGTDNAPHQTWILDIVNKQQDPVEPPQTANFRGRLRNYGFNTKCLRAVGGDNGAELEVADCSETNQELTIRLDGFSHMKEGAAYIQFDVSQKCLSLNGFSSDNGVHILLWDCVNQDNQKWSIVNGQLETNFQLKLKSTDKCLTAEGGGTYLDQWDCVGNQNAPHQSWTLDVIEDNKPDIQPPQMDLPYKGLLRNYAFNTKCLHAVGGDNGAELDVVDCSETNQQLLIKMESFQNMDNEHGYIQFDVSQKCLSLNGFEGDNGVHILIWDCVDQDNQKWRIINHDSGNSFQLQLKSTGKCLTAEGGGTYVDQWDCVGAQNAPHQSWTIDRVYSTSKLAPYTFFQLENFNSPNNCLRYKDGSASNYALELAPCDSEDLSQRMMPFTEYADSLGYTGLQFTTTATCLDVSGESNTDGAAVGQYGCVNQANQRWRMEHFQDDGSFRIKTEIGDRCLTSEGGGTYMDIWECYDRSSAPHQYWKQRNPNVGRSLKKLYVLQNFNWPDKCLHPIGTSSENGAELELVNCDSIKPVESMNTNEWLNYDTTAGYVKFNGKCLSMSGFESDNGIRLVQWDCVDQANQRWQIVNGDIDTNFQLKSEQSGKCLTAEGDGTYMDQWDCVGRDNAPHQSWMIKAIGGGQHDEPSGNDPEKFFEPQGALLQMMDYPGKCLSATGNSNEVILADCDQFDANQLFDHTDLLNYNTHPGRLKVLGTEKCLTVSSNGHVTQNDCDITNLDEMWMVVLGTLFGEFKLKASQSPKCITAEENGSFTDITDCFVVVSDSRKRRSLEEPLSRDKRALTTRASIRLSYKMSQPDNNKLFLIRNAYFPGYCLTRDGEDGWTESDLGIEGCNEDDEAQQWSFEQVGNAFENRFFVRNGKRCLWSKGTGAGKPVDYQNACIDNYPYIFRFLSASLASPHLFELQNEASNLCMQVKWYHDDAKAKYVDYIEQQPCGLVGWSEWMANPIYDSSYDQKCGPKYGGKFCTGKNLGQCCSIYGFCGTTPDYCYRLKCDPRHGPCIKPLDKATMKMDGRCGPWAATFPNNNGRCTGRYEKSCCSSYGVCGDQDEHCLLDNCDAEYGICPTTVSSQNDNKCGPLFGNKKCTGRYSEQCCSKNPLTSGSCGTTHRHCNPGHCDEAFGKCPGVDECYWANNSKKICKAGDCCSNAGKCGTSESFCGFKNCNIQLSCGTRCNGGLTTTAVGLYPEQFGTCKTTTCSKEGEVCSRKEWCCDSLRCVSDPDNSEGKYKAKKCVQ